MPLTFESYWPFALFPALVYLWWVRRRTKTSLGRRHQNVLWFLRSSIVLLLLLALARPHWNRPGTAISAVFLLDVSRSISPEFLSAAIQWSGDAVAEGEPAHSRFIGFAASSTMVERASELRSLAVYDGGAMESGAAPPPPGAIDQSGTNIERAARQALASFAPESLKRLVLVTDGHETEGDLAAVVPELDAAGVRVFTVPAAVRAEGDSWIERIEVPKDVRAGETVAVEVSVFSRAAKSAVVSLETTTSRLAQRQVDLPPGFSRVAFETKLPQAGLLDLQARIETDQDPFVGNDSRVETVSVAPPLRVLYIEGHPPSASYLERALEGEGLEVTVVPGTSASAAARRLSPYDVVILSDVSAKNLDAQAMLALEAYVRDEDGGLIFAAGETSYGEEGYTDTVVERILPVEFRVEEKWKDLSLVIVLDKSYSMYGKKIALAKEATKAALDLLEETHRFGVVTFDWNPYVTIPLQLATNKDWIKDGISRIQASAQTNIYPALERAFEQLVESPSKVKHVILLSDGKTYPDDYEELIVRMTEKEITVSSVAVGEEADRELLGDIARWGNGRSYFIEDAEKVQQIFIEETQIALEATLVEESFAPLVKREIEAFRGIDFEKAPQLKGYVSTLPRDAAEVILEAQDEDPLLARWHYGIGRSVAFTSDVKNRWAVDWLQWDGYGKFWSQLVRETARRNHRSEVDFKVDRRGSAAEVELSVVDASGHYPRGLEPALRVLGPAADVRTVPLRQTAPGRYHASVPVSISPSSPWRFELDAEGIPEEDLDQVGRTRTVFYPYPDEYRFYPPDVAKLEGLSRETGEKSDRPWKRSSQWATSARASKRLSRRYSWASLFFCISWTSPSGARRGSGRSSSQPVELGRLAATIGNAAPARSRVIGRLAAEAPGPMLIVVGSIHGNEPAGVEALESVVERLARESLIARGDFLAFIGNVEALTTGVRYLDYDLNRRWSREALDRLRSGGRVESSEDRERKELYGELEKSFAAARGPVALLDLHTTSGDGKPFAVFADTLRSRRFARRFPVPAILGLEENLEGTLADYVGLLGHVAVAFEGGQHRNPDSVSNLAAVVWIALAELMMVDPASAGVDRERARLRRATEGIPPILEVTYRHAIFPQDRFQMRPGFRSFDPVFAGQVIAEDSRGSVGVPSDGFLLMPLYQKLGNDGFFVARRVRGFWLALSAALRTLRAGRIAHWLPGVTRSKDDRNALSIDRRVARFYALPLLHLLGFRRRSDDGERLTVERRAELP